MEIKELFNMSQSTSETTARLQDLPKLSQHESDLVFGKCDEMLRQFLQMMIEIDCLRTKY